MKTNELKACPFCNGTNLRTTDDVEGRPRYRAVYCFDCNARWYTNTEGTFDTWNTRPIEDGLRAEIEGLKNVLMEIRDLARTGSAPDSLNLDTEEKWLRYKVNRIAAMADKGRE